MVDEVLVEVPLWNNAAFAWKTEAPKNVRLKPISMHFYEINGKVKKVENSKANTVFGH